MQSILLAIHDRARASACCQALRAEGRWQTLDPVHRFADVRATLIRRPPDLLVADLRLADGSLIDMIQAMRAPRHQAEDALRTQVLVLTGQEADPLLLQALQAGADNFYDTRAHTPEALASHVYETLAGGAAIAPWIARRLLDHFSVDRRSASSQPIEDLNNPLALTPAERTLLCQLSVGERLADVARRQGVVPREITGRVRAIYRKMQWALLAGDLKLA